jgi:uncharacterized protein (DUF362 family)
MKVFTGMFCQKIYVNFGKKIIKTNLKEDKMDLSNVDVSAEFTDIKSYNFVHPYNPPEKYPEFKNMTIDKTNVLYSKVRQLFIDLGMDKENINTEKWNPFNSIIKPGMTVFIKPNTVSDKHKSNGDIMSVITHASILRPILDYVCLALNGEGRIIIGDSQLYDSDFDRAMEISGIYQLLDWYRTTTKIPIECFDLRINKAKRTILYGRWARQEIKKDPRGYQFVDLKDESYFNDIDPKKLRIAIASHKNMTKYHSNGHHQYLFPKSLLESDVIINIPKLKTHRRTGITIAIKNFMGLASLKDSLPHFKVGSPEEGGDQFIHKSVRKNIGTWMHDRIQTSPFLIEKFFFAVLKNLNWGLGKIIPFKDDVSEAMWPGNDTVWRTLLDLNRAAFYSDKDGNICDTIQRKNFCIVDGIIGGDGNGPVSPDPVYSGVLIAGANPVAVDTVAVTLMGFDPEKLRLIKKGLEDKNKKSPLFFGSKNEIEIFDNGIKKNLVQFGKDRNFHFKPHETWAGHIERE